MADTQDAKPLGWRARFGVIIPTVNTVTEPEFHAMAPDGVTSHFTRMPIHFHPEEDDFKELMDDLEIRLIELKTCGSTIVAYNCTVGSMACPADMLKAKLEGVTGAPAVATAASVLKALEVLGVKRISMATPYSEETNEHEKEYLAAHGIEVVAMAGFDFSKSGDGGAQGSDWAAVAPGERPVEECRAGVANVEEPRGARREAGDDVGHGPSGFSPAPEILGPERCGRRRGRAPRRSGS